MLHIAYYTTEWASIMSLLSISGINWQAAQRKRTQSHANEVRLGLRVQLFA